jgi:hypothetical protein
MVATADSVKGGAQMREITMPEVKLPVIRLPEGLRDMSRDDIVQAVQDVRMPNIDMPTKIEMPDIDLSGVHLPKQITDRLPRRRRPNPVLPIAGIVAIGAMIAAVWWLFTSSMTGPRVRAAVNDLKSRVTGEKTDLVRYDNDDNLGSLLADEGNGHSSMGAEAVTSSSSMTDLSGFAPKSGVGTVPESIGR